LGENRRGAYQFRRKFVKSAYLTGVRDSVMHFPRGGMNHLSRGERSQPLMRKIFGKNGKGRD